MRNVFAVLRRDILRLLKTPAAMLVVIALMFLPSLYTWYNVRGFWDPYQSTGDLHVCVVDQDTGADNELTGHIDVGQMIIEELRSNHELDWQFVSFDEAMHQLDSEQSYAAFVIPEDFSSNLLTLTTGDFHKPTIDFYVNEKVGPVAPKITTTGADTLEDKVNTAFVRTVSEKAVEALDQAIGDSRERASEVRSYATQKIDQAKDGISQASQTMLELAGQADTAKRDLDSAKSALDGASSAISSAASAMDDLSKTASNLQSSYAQFSASAIPAMSNAMKGVADAYAEAARAIASAPVQGEQAQALLEQLRASADRAQADADAFSNVLANDVSPAINNGIGDVARASAEAGGALSAQTVLIEQTQSIMGSAQTTLSKAKEALDSTHELLDTTISQIEKVRTDAMALASSDAITKLIGQQTLDPTKVSDFISAPTNIVTEHLYPADTYGSAMAPLFMNLTFWIGCFMLMVVFRQDVDGEGIKRLTLTQRYIARYLLFAIMAVLQAVVCCAGLPIIGVHVVNLPALFFAASFTSLAYLSIIYALSVTLQHVGKGVCVVLVFIQIPGATGLYPIEMTNQFFQFVYPLFPFTYGISAMREAICGFYGTHYASDLGILAGYLAVFMALGILLRPLMANVNRLFAKEIKQSGMFNGDDAEIPMRRFRLSQMIRALTNTEGYRDALIRRYERFERIYPKIMRATIVVGIAVPVIVSVVFSLGLAEKVALITIWLCWLLVVFVFLIVVESLKASFARQLRLDGMTQDQLRELFSRRDETAKEGEDA